jgi:RND superfamily putative drug exporter
MNHTTPGTLDICGTPWQGRGVDGGGHSVGERLYRIGAWSARRRRRVVVAWLLILVVLGGVGAAFARSPSDSFSVPGTQSQRALDLLTEKFPGTGGATARVVVAAPPGHKLTEPQYQNLAATTIAAVRKAPQVLSVGDTPTMSKDERVVFDDVNYAVPVDQVSEGAKAALEAALAPVRAAGLEVEFSGGVIATAEKAGNTELYGVLVAFLVLTITFGALVAAGLPLLTAAIGVGTGLLGIQALSSVVSLSSTAPTLALMLGLAVGIDYTLFILSRHRQQLRAGMAMDESIAMATATAGGAVVFAGLTVVMALCGLAVTGIPFLTVMGLGAAGTVAGVVVIAITLVPALLAMLGHRIENGRLGFLARRQDEVTTGGQNFGRRWSRIATAKPWLTVVAVVGCVVVVSLPLKNMNLGLPDDATKPTSTTERRAYDLLASGFGPGFNGPLTLVVYAPGHTDVATLAAKGATALQTVPDVAAVSAPIPNKAGDLAILSVTPNSGPSSTATKALVAQIVTAAERIKQQTGVEAYVTGTTAINIDVSDKLGHALPLFLALIVLLALFLLLLVFRSILVPIKAVVGFLCSLGVSMGLTVWVFQEGHLGSLFHVEATSPVISFLPILLIGILFGLAMDYEMFLVTRVREEYVHHGDAEAAIEAGMGLSARVVTAAGLIMTSVFASFILGDNVVIKSIGFALAIGVLVDAFVVRMTLVPAVLKLLGDRAWALPGRLDRILPNLDIEGAELTKAREVSDTVSVPTVVG